MLGIIYKHLKTLKQAKPSQFASLPVWCGYQCHALLTVAELNRGYHCCVEVRLEGARKRCHRPHGIHAFSSYCSALSSSINPGFGEITLLTPNPYTLVVVEIVRSRRHG